MSKCYAYQLVSLYDDYVVQFTAFFFVPFIVFPFAYAYNGSVDKA